MSGLEKPQKRSCEELFSEIARARRDAEHFRKLMTLVTDPAIKETLRLRAAELETSARTLEAEAPAERLRA